MRGKVRHARNLAMRQMVGGAAGGGGGGAEAGGTPLPPSAVGGISSPEGGVGDEIHDVGAHRSDYVEV